MLSNRVIASSYNMVARNMVARNMVARSIVPLARCFSSDFIDFENRGILNEENLESYEYLRHHKSDWTYDAFHVHPRLHQRLLASFDAYDKNAAGKITLEEVSSWGNKLKEVLKLNDSDDKAERLMDAVKGVYQEGMGVTTEGLCREDWVEANHAFYEAEKLRLERGESQNTARLGDAVFDALDVNNDDTVDAEEFGALLKAWNPPNVASETLFADSDVNTDGVLQRAEVHDLFREYYLKPVKPVYHYLLRELA